jgi:hypothetical protein
MTDTTRPQYPIHLAQGHDRILQMLDDIKHHHPVNTTIIKRIRRTIKVMDDIHTRKVNTINTNRIPCLPVPAA